EGFEPASIIATRPQADVPELLRDVISGALELRTARRASFQIVGCEELDVVEQPVSIDRSGRAKRGGQQQERKETPAHQTPSAVSSWTRSRVLSEGTRTCATPCDASSAGTAPTR